MKNSSTPQKKRKQWVMALCIIVGCGIGFIIGAAFSNIGAGLLGGLAIGLAAGCNLTAKQE